MNPAQMNIKANRKCWRKIRIGLHSRWETQITIVLVEKFDKSEIFIFKWVLNFLRGCILRPWTSIQVQISQISNLCFASIFSHTTNSLQLCFRHTYQSLLMSKICWATLYFHPHPPLLRNDRFFSLHKFHFLKFFYLFMLITQKIPRRINEILEIFWSGLANSVCACRL